MASKLRNFKKHEMFADRNGSSPWCQAKGMYSNSYRDFPIILSSRF